MKWSVRPNFDRRWMLLCSAVGGTRTTNSNDKNTGSNQRGALAFNNLLVVCWKSVKVVKKFEDMLFAGGSVVACSSNW